MNDRRKLTKEAYRYMKKEVGDAIHAIRVGEPVRVLSVDGNGKCRVQGESFGWAFDFPASMVDRMPIADKPHLRSIEDMEFEEDMVEDSRD